MKVILINGSPRKSGNCGIVCREFAEQIEAKGIDTEILQIGSLDISGCKGCWSCEKTGMCFQNDEAFHEAAAKIYEADGIMITAPVYYDSIPGQLKNFLDRLFFQDRKKGRLQRKVAAAFSVQRRAGGVSALDSIYHFMLCAGMLIVPSKGECTSFGLEPGEVMIDHEGLDIIHTLADNMIWLMNLVAASRK